MPKKLSEFSLGTPPANPNESSDTLKIVKVVKQDVDKLKTENAGCVEHLSFVMGTMEGITRRLERTEARLGVHDSYPHRISGFTEGVPIFPYGSYPMNLTAVEHFVNQPPVMFTPYDGMNDMLRRAEMEAGYPVMFNEYMHTVLQPNSSNYSSYFTDDMDIGAPSYPPDQP